MRVWSHHQCLLYCNKHGTFADKVHRRVSCRSVKARCGIIGIYGRGEGTAADLYEGLLMLQHRGQDSAGMVTTDWSKYVEHRGNGLVRDVFANEKVMKSLKGTSVHQNICPAFVLRCSSSTTKHVG
jgi:glutamate synthase domain-containing protein 1